MSCANLICGQQPTSRLRYQGRDRDHVYELCETHTDHAHLWLAERPHLAVTAISTPITAQDEQPALF